MTDRDWAAGTVLTHTGSNGLWYATAWVAPVTGRAYFATSNIGGDSALWATDDVVAHMIFENL